VNTFYSILYVPLKQEAHERLSVGLFMRDGKHIHFAYSKFKLGVVKELLSKSAYDLLTLNLRNIDRAVTAAIKETGAESNELNLQLANGKGSLKEAYFGYLSRYSNNLLAFTSPSSIAVAATEPNFETLFAKFVDERHFLAKDVIEDIDIVQKMRTTLRPLIRERVNWDFEITRQHVPKLILPSVHMDFAGKNEIMVSGQAVDFDKKSYFLENDISKHIVLLDAMKQANKNSTSFVLGKEPNKKEHPKNHHIWKNVVAENRIEFVDADEYERITEYMELHDVKPLML
tara:strand:+ start:17739 stop:18599 length:861 start_codon:yes stop_codon:yes gene_type:complete